MLRKIFDFISHVADFFKEDDERPIFKRNTHLIIRPDGSWVLDKQPTQPTTPKIIKAPPLPPTYYNTPSSAWSVWDEIGEVLEPPDFFPHKTELTKKLKQCLDLNVVSSCVHTKTKNGTYLLQVEVPCTDDYSASFTQFKLFVKAMEKQYEFVAIQQDRVLSKVSNENSHLVVFEYDPRKKLF